MLIQINKTMRQKFNVILTLLLAFVVQVTFAQEKTISGTVSSDQGMPLAGVNVVVQGTTTGTQTDFDGNYSISVSQGQVLEFSYIGFATSTKTVGGQSIIDVTLAVDAAQLAEVVVVGYGTTTKQSFTGTAAVVSGEELSQKNVTDVSQALQGEVAGVRVINTSGQPGTDATIRIRGFGSVNGNRDPLYVVDGVPYSGSITAINPSDIESTVILKDATATAVYGSRGANGVVLIQTKDGVAGKSYIEVSAKTGQNFQILPRYSTIESPETYIGLSWEGLYNRGVISGEPDPVAYANQNLFSGIGIVPRYNMWNVDNVGELIDPATGTVRSGVTRKYSPEDWDDYAFNPSNRTEANVRIGGGTEKTTYFASFGYLKDKGYIVNSDFERFSTRLNITHEVKDWLSGTMNMGYTLSETNNNGQAENSTSVFWFADNIPSIYPLFLRDGDGNLVPDPIFGGNQYDYGDATANGRGFGAFANPVADATYNLMRNMQHEINLSNTFKAQITDGLTLETRFGLQYYNSSYDARDNPFYGSRAGLGSIFKQKDELFSHNFLQLLRYKTDFGDHSLEVFVAHESNSWERHIMEGSKTKLIIPDGEELDNGVVSAPSSSYTWDYTLESYFGQINYNFDDKYFFSGTVRRDGTSRFVEGNKWGTFGAVGGAWVITNEDFMDDQNWLSNLKVKASYGLTGEQAGVGYYAGRNLFVGDNLNDEISIAFDKKGNPDLTWETSVMYQAGVEFGIKSFLEGSVDYYIKNTKDLLFDRRVPPSLGYAIITVNDGELRNSGLEFNLTAHILDHEDYFLDFNVNGTFLTNELTKMPMDPATGMEKVLDVSGYYGRSAGHSLYDYYMPEWAGVDPETGVGQWNSYYVDANGNGQAEEVEVIENMANYVSENPGAKISVEKTTDYSLATNKYIGKSAIPDVRGAFSLKGGYKGFTLSVQFLYSIGGYGYDFVYSRLMHNGQAGSNNWHTDILNRWQEPGDITNVPRISGNLDQNVSSASSRFLIKKDYLSLNNVRLGYTIPDNFVESMGLAKLNIFVTGTNLLLLNKRDGYNPMTSEAGESDWYTYSPLSSVTAGVNISF